MLNLLLIMLSMNVPTLLVIKLTIRLLWYTVLLQSSGLYIVLSAVFTSRSLCYFGPSKVHYDCIMQDLLFLKHCWHIIVRVPSPIVLYVYHNMRGPTLHQCEWVPQGIGGYIFIVLILQVLIIAKKQANLILSTLLGRN